MKQFYTKLCNCCLAEGWMVLPRKLVIPPHPHPHPWSATGSHHANMASPAWAVRRHCRVCDTCSHWGVGDEYGMAMHPGLPRTDLAYTCFSSGMPGTRFHCQIYPVWMISYMVTLVIKHLNPSSLPRRKLSQTLYNLNPTSHWNSFLIPCWLLPPFLQTPSYRWQWR